METETKMKNDGYLQITDPSTLRHFKEGPKYTCLKILCHVMAALNLVTALSVTGLSIVYIGFIVLLEAFTSFPKRHLIFGVCIINLILYIVLTVAWIVMIGALIRSLVKKEVVRSPAILCRQMLHTSAIWFIVMRAILAGSVAGLQSIEWEGEFILAIITSLIEFAVNLLFIIIYYVYAVNLKFGLIPDESGDSIKSFVVCSK